MNKQHFYTAFAFLLLALLCWGGYRLVVITYDAFLALQPNVAVAIVAGCMTISGSVVALVLGRHFEAKKNREAVHRDKKMELYDEFTKKMFQIISSPDSIKGEDLVPYLREMQRKLMLWSGPGSVIRYAEWHKALSSQGEVVRADSVIKMVDLFLELRRDLGHDNAGLKREHIMQLFLKNAWLLTEMHKENSNVTMDEVSEREKIIMESLKNQKVPEPVI